jgi:FixJ family two-component response regulator
VSEPQQLVFVVDDDPSVRKAIGSLLGSAGLRAYTFASAGEFLAHPRTDAPACLVLDMALRETSGLELQHELRRREDTLPIVFITGHGDVPTTVRAMKQGAVEFLSKPFEEEELLAAVRLALEKARATWKENAALAEVKRKLTRLTPRERQVLAGVVAGLLNKQIASDLGISLVTVKIHRAQVMHKTEAQSVPDLVRMVERGGFHIELPNT